MGGLDGLRAIAVISVIAFHFLPGAAVGGYVGVDVFFVISGFLITGLLVRERAKTGRIGLTAFWARRARRLLPALVLVVLACGAAAFFIGGDVLVRLGSQVLGAATFSSNWLFILQGSSYFGDTTPELFRNLWSLAVEEQFYLLWPLLLLLLLLIENRFVRAAIALVIAVGSAAGMVLLSAGDGTRVYYGTDTHSFGLALGAALAFLVQARFLGDARPARAWRVILPILGTLAVAGVVVLAAVLREDAPFTTRGGLALVAVLTAVAILGSTTPGSWLGRALDVAPIRWVGERSYGLYLWHWPVLVLFVAALPPDAAWWLAPACALAITVAAAAASHRFVETPIRRYGLRGAVSRASTGLPGIQFAAVLGTVLLFTAGTVTAQAVAVDPRAGQAQTQIEEGQAFLARPGYAVAPRRPQPLPTGDQILAIGDSVMLAAAPELSAAFPGIAIDATVSRQMADSEAIVASIIATGGMRPILVIGLGTNGWIDEATLEHVRGMLDRETMLILVNVQAPREWTPEVNGIIGEFARQLRSVELANWHDAIQPHLDVLANDDIHMGAAGARIYAAALADALQRLAELPPLRDEDDYKFTLRPV
jgi:peptidoglycan/LPS O-acetylase OafA/YrhL